MSTCKGAWKLQEVRDQILAGEWIQYNVRCEPGEIWTWGLNDCGQLGDGTVIARSSPVQIPGSNWNDVSKSTNYSLARKYDNTLWTWGFNGNGALGVDDRITRSSPTQIPGTSWSNISAGGQHNAARKTDGTLWLWGSNTNGKLGLDNNDGSKSSPVQVPGTSWSGSPDSLAVGSNSTLALKTDGTLWAWGENYRGQLGVGNKIDRSSPTQVPGTSWCFVNAASSNSHAIKTDGTLWAWGQNSYGKLGIGTSGPGTYTSSPVQIPGTNWIEVSGGGSTALARKTDGTLWIWGQNVSGTLGDNTVISKSSPVQVPGTSWNIAVNDGAQVMARKTDGTLWSWGSNGDGELGDGTRIPKSSPIQIPGTRWNYISNSNLSGIARKEA